MADKDVMVADGVAVITVPTKFFDAFAAKAFRAEVMKLCEAGQKTFVVDFSNVEFMDSAGIGAILLLYKTVSAEGSLVVCGVRKRIDEILQMVHLKNLLPSFDTLEGALKQAKVPQASAS